MPGGVWRIKQHKSGGKLALACMNGGFVVVDAEDLDIRCVYGDKHASLAYGVDWDASEGSSDVIVSCSFYDNLLTTWKMKE